MGNRRTWNRRPRLEELEPRVVFSVTSTNWSGYAAETSFAAPQAGAVSHVEGSWTVPAVLNTSGTAYSSFWVGIDGYSSPSVEQIGTDSDIINGVPSYYAWYEMYPDPFHTITSITVQPGDTISASVTALGSNSFLLTLTDGAQSFSEAHTFSGSTIAQQSSAEWIAEAPSGSFGHVLPLANFGSVTFSGASATINGVTGPINKSTWQNTAINMVSKRTVIATTSSLTADGSGFTVQFTGSTSSGGGGHHGGPHGAFSQFPAIEDSLAVVALAISEMPAAHALAFIPTFEVSPPLTRAGALDAGGNIGDAGRSATFAVTPIRTAFGGGMSESTSDDAAPAPQTDDEPADIAWARPSTHFLIASNVAKGTLGFTNESAVHEESAAQQNLPRVALSDFAVPSTAAAIDPVAPAMANGSSTAPSSNVLGLAAVLAFFSCGAFFDRAQDTRTDEEPKRAQFARR